MHINVLVVMYIWKLFSVYNTLSENNTTRRKIEEMKEKNVDVNAFVMPIMSKFTKDVHG